MELGADWLTSLNSVITLRPFRKPNTIETRGIFKDHYGRAVTNRVIYGPESSVFANSIDIHDFLRFLVEHVVGTSLHRKNNETGLTSPDLIVDFNSNCGRKADGC